MHPTRPRISPKVLRELTQRLHENDAQSTSSWLESVISWSGLLAIGIWAVLIIAALIALLLLPFGYNFTVEWLRAAGWTVGISFMLVGAWLIAQWLDLYFHDRHSDIGPLIFGLVILISTISLALLYWHGLDENTSPLTVLSEAIVLASMLIGLGVYQFVTQPHKALIIRIVGLVAMASTGVGMFLTVILSRPQTFALDLQFASTLHWIANICLLAGWPAVFISNARTQPARRQYRGR